MSNQDKFSSICSPDIELCRSLAHSSNRNHGGVLHEEDTISLTEINDPVHSRNMESVYRCEPLHVQTILAHPSNSDSLLKQGLCSHKRGEIVMKQILGHGVPSHTQDSRSQFAQRSGSEGEARGPTFAQAAIPVPKSVTELGQHDDAGGMRTSPDPPGTSAALDRNTLTTILPTNDRVIGNSFCTVTIENEEQKRRVLGTFLDSEFPDIPDIFMNCQNYIAHSDKWTKPREGSENCAAAEPDPIRNFHTTTELGNPAPGVGMVNEEEARLLPYERSVDMEMFIMRSSTPDIFKDFRHIPVSSLNAFIDGDGDIEVNLESKTMLVTEDTSNFSADQMNTTERNTITDDQMTFHYRSSFGSSRSEMLAKDQIDFREDCFEVPTSPLVMLPGTIEHTQQTVGEGSRVNRPFALTQPSWSKLSVLEVEAQDNREAVKKDYAGGSLPVEDATTRLMNEDTLPNPTTSQTFSQELQAESNIKTIQLPRSIRMNNLWRKVIVFNKKIDRQRQSGSSARKYYSLRRMEKDLSEQLNLSQEVFHAALKLHHERMELVEACEKEKKEIERLRKRFRT